MSSPTALEIYVYYRLQLDQTATARAAFDAARAGAPVRVLQRHDSDPLMVTWMEIYGPGLADPLQLEQHIANAMAPYVQGLRHRELFTPLKD
jgi:hypothetical protein